MKKSTTNGTAETQKYAKGTSHSEKAGKSNIPKIEVTEGEFIKTFFLGHLVKKLFKVDLDIINSLIMLNDTPADKLKIQLPTEDNSQTIKLIIEDATKGTEIKP